MLQGNVFLRFAVGALEILSCDMVQHVLIGVTLQELRHSRCIYQPGSARKVLCNTFMFFIITVYVIQVSKYQTVLLHLPVHLGVRHPVGTSIDLMALLQSHAPSHTELISTQY